MTGFIIRRLVGIGGEGSDPQVRQRCGAAAGSVGLAVNLLLCAGKLAAGLLTGAISITADAFNNLSDAASSVVTLIGFRLAGQRPDRDHPFGHGRAEYLAGLAVSVLILVVGVELAKSSVEKIFHPQPVEFSWLSAAVLLVSVAAKLWLGRFNRVLGRRIGSTAMAATAADSLSDAAATGAVLAGLVVHHFTRWDVDGWVGLLVAAFILKTGAGSVRATLDPLLGQPPEESLVRDVEATVLACPQIVGLHDLVIHDYGPGRRMMSLHAEVPADANFLEIHDVIDRVERELKERYRLEAVIHMDPVASGDPQTCALRDRVSDLVRGIDPKLTIHDFRITAGPLLTNLIFDVVVPYQLERSDSQVRREVEDLVRRLGEEYTAVVEIDRSYVG